MLVCDRTGSKRRLLVYIGMYTTTRPRTASASYYRSDFTTSVGQTRTRFHLSPLGI